jgi:hypothetical protein
MKNFIIALGGTGAKCLEHLVYSCAAGLGPEQLWAGMIDQDEANGNISRTKVLLSKYFNLRKSLRETGKNDLSQDSSLFKTLITTNADSVWLPLKGANPTLKEMILYDRLKPEVQGLIDCLYNPEEKKQQLSEGFRARPNIGAAAMLATTTNEKDPFWSQIYKAIDQAKGGEEVRIFLLSSIFGGTGASGFPNIARRIKNIQKEMQVTSNLYVGGALMLPYFTYEVPDEDVEEEMFARPEQFIEQTKGALEYYANLFKHNKIFDQLYITGWDPLSKIPNFMMGGNLQNNPPLFPELYAALGALKFFDKNNSISENQEIFHIGKNPTNNVVWEDIPDVSNELSSKERISRLIRFAFSYNWMYGPSLTGSWARIKKYSNENWFKRLIYKQTYNSETKQCEIGHENRQEIVLSMKEFCHDILLWFTDMYYSTEANSDQKVNLLSPEFFSEYRPNEVADRVSLKEKLNMSEKKQFNNLITDDSNFKLLNIMSNICYNKINKNQRGLGVFMDTLFKSCKK